jgi:predicted amidophosphoribosyltransferase
VPHQHPRMAREAATVTAMIRLYCRDFHASQALCDACQELQDYANQRLERCPYQEGKTTCARCPVHCYKPEMRQRIREVMRYAGPRMLLRHPWMAVMHLIDGARKKPIKKAARISKN